MDGNAIRDSELVNDIWQGVYNRDSNNVLYNGRIEWLRFLDSTTIAGYHSYKMANAISSWCALILYLLLIAAIVLEVRKRKKAPTA